MHAEENILVNVTVVTVEMARRVNFSQHRHSNMLYVGLDSLHSVDSSPIGKGLDLECSISKLVYVSHFPRCDSMIIMNTVYGIRVFKKQAVKKKFIDFANHACEMYGINFLYGKTHKEFYI